MNKDNNTAANIERWGRIWNVYKESGHDNWSISEFVDDVRYSVYFSGKTSTTVYPAIDKLYSKLSHIFLNKSSIIEQSDDTMIPKHEIIKRQKVLIYTQEKQINEMNDEIIRLKEKMFLYNTNLSYIGQTDWNLELCKLQNYILSFIDSISYIIEFNDTQENEFVENLLSIDIPSLFCKEYIDSYEIEELYKHPGQKTKVLIDILCSRRLNASLNDLFRSKHIETTNLLESCIKIQCKLYTEEPKVELYFPKVGCQVCPLQHDPINLEEFPKIESTLFPGIRRIYNSQILAKARVRVYK